MGESWKPAEKLSLWTSSLSKLHWDSTLFSSKDHETPEKMGSTEALQVPQRATPNLMFDLLEGNSNEHEDDELLEVTKSKQSKQFISLLFKKLFNSTFGKIFLNAICFKYIFKIMF